jgi:rod shape-determining protein MreD
MIKNVIMWVVLFFMAFVLQTSFVSNAAIFSIKPDLIIIVLFLMAMKVGIIPGVFTGFVIGLAQDLYIPGVLGQNARAKTIAGFAAGLFNEKVMRWTRFLRLFTVIYFYSE